MEGEFTKCLIKLAYKTRNKDQIKGNRKEYALRTSFFLFMDEEGVKLLDTLRQQQSSSRNSHKTG